MWWRPFGKRFTTSGGNPARRDPTFQQRTYDEGLGIYDYRNRSFDPATGRFLQRDPVLDGNNLYNPYVGMGNNPVGNVDPMGSYLYAKNKAAGSYAKSKLRSLGLNVDIIRGPYGPMVDIKTNNSKGALKKARGKTWPFSTARKIIDTALDNNTNYAIDGDGGIAQTDPSALKAWFKGLEYGADLGAAVVVNTVSLGHLAKEEMAKYGGKKDKHLVWWSRNMTKVAVGAAAAAGGAALAGVGATVVTIKGVTITTTAGVAYFSALGGGAFAGTLSALDSGDFGDIFTGAGTAGFMTGLMLRLSGMHQRSGRVDTSPRSGSTAGDRRSGGPNELRARDVEKPTKGEGGVYQFEKEGKVKTGSTGDFYKRYGGKNIKIEYPQTRNKAAADDSAYQWTPRRQRRFDEEFIDRQVPPDQRYRDPDHPKPPVGQDKWRKFRHIFGYGDEPE